MKTVKRKLWSMADLGIYNSVSHGWTDNTGLMFMLVITHTLSLTIGAEP